LCPSLASPVQLRDFFLTHIDRHSLYSRHIDLTHDVVP
jgi:hypothetical protein